MQEIDFKRNGSQPSAKGPAEWFTGEVRILPDEAEACGWTAHFESVIGYGTVVELSSAEEKIHGLNQIMQHYSGQAWTYNPSALKSARVWAIEITSLTGKRCC
ncbi:MAG: pyridoxamine 5'-phosphate oxidase family protein [Anaerolineales bacterium]